MSLPRSRSTAARSARRTTSSATPALTLLKPPAGPFTLEIATFCQPGGQQGADRALPVTRHVYCTQCEAEGFRRITYFLDRPDVLATYTVRIEADRNEAPVLLVQRQPAGARHARRRQAPLRRVARSVPQALLPVRAGRRRPRLASPPTSRTMSGRKVDARHLRRARQGGAAAPGPWTRSSAPCAGTRSASGASTTSTCSTSSPCPTSTWARWRTRASTSSTTG